MQEVTVSNKDVLALIGQKELDKLALQQQLESAAAEIARLRDKYEPKGSADGAR